MGNSNLKEYKRTEFGIDQKKNSFQITTKDGKDIYKNIKLDFHFPSEFRYRNQWDIDGEELKLYFKGGTANDTNEDLIKLSNSERSETINENVESRDIPVVKKLRICFVRDQNEDGSGFLPETTGGGILVGT
ncbi:hypothetical protein [Gramella sp. AN32]|uniref:Uncharacterized protein n=1 Tax=Christiangramia antarctica TaxID=2058158 RepID=A0ABW5XB18_9FLAO|nr:hypothetical protein [Gramella sp. AN32]MCM4157345.1 hypothetical protein [Gramella sp. AN32]